jgi:16S rRNA (cytosine1402-N4)-methyltransferase
LKEAIEHLAIKLNGIYIDATFGRGGHTQAILDRLNENGRIIAIDKDPVAIATAKQKFADEKRLIIFQDSFANVKQICSDENLIGKVDGILIDLGVSSPQVDDPQRGFSFLHDGPLDMRMDPTKGINAAQWLAKAEANEIASVLKDYGEERFAKRIATAIVQERALEPIKTTKRLAEIISKANPAWEKHKHPATRSFQAIRIFINAELNDLQICLTQCLEILNVSGRLAVISFHSLEDRIVKQFMRQQERGIVLPKGLAIQHFDQQQRLRKIIGPLRPSVEEVKQNPRSRSAILRVEEKIQ